MIMRRLVDVLFNLLASSKTGFIISFLRLPAPHESFFVRLIREEF